MYIKLHTFTIILIIITFTLFILLMIKGLYSIIDIKNTLDKIYEKLKENNIDENKK